MARKCSVCSLPKVERGEVDSLLIGGQSLQSISQNPRFHSKFSYSSLYRHSRAKHIPAKLAKAQEAREVSDASSLLKEVQSLHAKSLAILQKGEEANDLRTCLSAIRECRGVLELLAKLLHEIPQEGTTNVLLVSNPEWISLRSRILVALDGFPAARLALAEALKGVDNAGN